MLYSDFFASFSERDDIEKPLQLYIISPKISLCDLENTLRFVERKHMPLTNTLSGERKSPEIFRVTCFDWNFGLHEESDVKKPSDLISVNKYIVT